MLHPLRTTALVLALATPAVAQQLPPMQSDQPLNFALQDMLNTLGYACQTMGDQNACGAFSYVQGAADYMVGADQYCQQGNPQACQDYGRAWQDVSATYASFSQATYGNQMPDMSGQVPQINPLGDTHADRMNNIAAWGAANTEAVNQRAAINDANNAAYLSTITN